MARNLWTRDEMILALSLYFRLPFGRLNHGTPEVKKLAKLIGRTDNSVALRLVNYAACDPYILATGRHGMAQGASVCKPYWEEFANDKERLFFEAKQIEARLLQQPIEEVLAIEPSQLEGKERLAVVKQRIGQDAFHDMILANYNIRCAVTGIDIPTMLAAGHIIPWSVSEEHRLDPENGICLSPLYHEAFDQGFISLDDQYCILLAPKLKEYAKRDYYDQHFASLEHRRILLPDEHSPNHEYLEWHRDVVFNK